LTNSVDFFQGFFTFFRNIFRDEKIMQKAEKVMIFALTWFSNPC